MNKNKNFQLELDPNFISNDDITNQSIDHDIKNNFSINNTDANTKPAIRKTKTTRASSSSKHRQNKRKNSPKKIKKSPNKNGKKVKFIEKIDIVKVECWKKYNLEQTADECEFLDDYLNEFDNGNSNNTTTSNNANNSKKNNSNKNDDKNENNTKNKDRKNKGNKQKKGNYTCTCNII